MPKEYLKLENELLIKVKIVPKSPLIIKEGTEKDAGSGASVNWFHDAGNNNIYIPGSTLKGLFRDRFYTMYQAVGKNVEDEFGEELENKLNNNDIKQEDVYEKSSDLSKLFGSKVLKSRFIAEDTYFINLRPEKKRNITPIDRFTGGAIVPLEYEYTTDPFTTDIHINNVTEEELRFIYFIIRDSINNEIRIGNSKTRGFGLVELEINKLEVRVFGNNKLNFINDEYFSEIEGIKIGFKSIDIKYELKDEYKRVDIHEPNDFIKSLFK